MKIARVNLSRLYDDVSHLRLKPVDPPAGRLKIEGPALMYHNDTLVIAHLKMEEPQPLVVKFLKVLKCVQDSRTGGLPTNSRIFGYAPRNTLRKDFCSATSLNFDNPTGTNLLMELARACEEQYKAINPGTYANHKALAEKILPAWRMKGTVYTQGIVNKNNPLRYHYDTGNFRGTWSAMTVFKNRSMGGDLDIPEYNITIKLEDHSLLLFDGQAVLHGVTPIRHINFSSYRYSIVYYSLQAMLNCGTPDQELARIRKVRVARERKRAGK